MGLCINDVTAFYGIFDIVRHAKRVNFVKITTFFCAFLPPYSGVFVTKRVENEYRVDVMKGIRVTTVGRNCRFRSLSLRFLTFLTMFVEMRGGFLRS